MIRPIARLRRAGVITLLIAGPAFLSAGLHASSFTSSYVRVKSDMHTGIIGRIATDRKGRYLLSCSVDKTAKLWDAGSGALLKTFYPPSGANQEGSLYACALSPDAQTVAVGGWTGWSEADECSVYLFNPISGELFGRISGLPYPVADLAFSPDGANLAVAFFKDFGVRVYGTRPLRLEKTLTGFGATCSRCVFDASGRLAVASADGRVRLYSADFVRFMEIAPTQGLLPYSLAFSENGERLAVGYENSAAVTVYSAHSLTKARLIPDDDDLRPQKRRVSLVTWSQSTDDLYVVITEVNPGDPATSFLRRYSGKDLSLADERIFKSGLLLDVKAMPDNSIAFCGVAHQLGRIGINQGLIFTQESDLYDLRGIGSGRFTLSRTAREIGCFLPGNDSFVFSVTNRSLQRFPEDSLVQPVSPPPALLAGQDGSSSIFLDSHASNVLKPSEYRLCAALDSAYGRVLVGTNWNLYMLDTAGELLWQKSTPGPVWAVALAPEAGMCAAALGDGTIRWYRLASGSEMLALAMSHDRKLWAVWTPGGQWDASVHGNNLLCMCVNHGNMHAAECRTLSRFDRDGYDPAAIARLFGEDDSSAIFTPSTLILQPVNGFVSYDSIIAVRVKTSSPRNAPVTQILLVVNGKQQRAGVRGLAAASRNEIVIQAFPIELRRGPNMISVTACNRWGCGDTAAIIVQRGQLSAGKQPCTSARRLFVLSVGISRYTGGPVPLTFADKDARDFSDFWLGQSPCPYRQVIRRVLTNESASRAAVLGGLSAMASQASRQDVIMLFVAGHALRDPFGRFSIVAADSQREAPQTFGQVVPHALRPNNAAYGTLITDKDLLGPLARTGARVLCIFDACDGGAAVAGFAKTVAGKGRGNIVILQASSTFQAARESSAWDNGVFTKALLEGLAGKADYTNSGVVTVTMLALYVSQRVRELTVGLQTPVATMPAAFADFPLASTGR
jgi:WD40 repeat protein